MKQLLLDIKPNEKPSLTNFVTGRNSELVQTLKNVIFARDKEQFVYIWGNSGCGKSHLLQAVVGEVLQCEYTAYYFSGEITSNIQTTDCLRCLAIDDVDLLDNESQITLFNIYNRMKEDGCSSLLVSGSLPPVQLNLRRDLVTRLGWGLVYQVHELTEDEKIKALQQKAAERGFVLKKEVCRYLLQHTRRDLPSLMMILDALDRFSLAHQRQITVPLLKEMLSSLS